MPKNILIVDDSKVVRQLIRSYLESQLDHVACAEASDGKDAIEHARQVRPDVIVLDLSMPVMNGLDAAPVLHQIVPQTPIILFTLHKDVVSEKHASDVGICAVVSKMDQIEVLLKHILDLTHISRSPLKN